MKLSMCLLLGVVALLELSYVQLSLQNCVDSNCNSNNIFGRKRRQILEDSTKGLSSTDVITAIVELLEAEDGQDQFGLQRKQILKEMLSEFEDSTKGLSSTDVITA